MKMNWTHAACVGACDPNHQSGLYARGLEIVQRSIVIKTGLGDTMSVGLQDCPTSIVVMSFQMLSYFGTRDARIAVMVGVHSTERAERGIAIKLGLMRRHSLCNYSSKAMPETHLDTLENGSHDNCKHPTHESTGGRNGYT